MTLNIAGIASAGYLPGSVTYRKIEKEGGETKQLDKVAADKGVKSDLAYVEKKIQSAKDVDDLLKDRKVMRFLLSSFGLESVQDSQAGLIKQVLTQDPSSKTSVANRMADPRYAQMAKTLNFFTNGLTKLKETTAGSSTYNLALNGNNYFVAQDTDASKNTVYRYVQSGAFAVDSKGYLAGPKGLQMQGWALDGDGNRPAADDEFNTYSASKLVSVKVNKLDNQFSPTEKITADVNLRSTVDGSTTGPHFIDTNVKVYDTNGTEQQLRFEYTKQNTNDGSNKWSLKIYNNSDSSLLNGTNGTELEFNPDGSLKDSQKSLELKTRFFGSFVDSKMNIDLSSVRSTTTDSYSLPMTTDSKKLGKYTKVDVDKNGIVSATYEGGKKFELYQLATASFSNSGGLLPDKDQKILMTANSLSGNAVIRVPGTTGGTIDTDSKAVAGKTLMNTLKEAYYRNEYEVAIGEQKGSVRLALYFKRNAGSATGIYNVLGDKILREVISTAYDIPQKVALQSETAQAGVFSKYVDVKKLSDPKYIDKIINQYLAKADAASAGQTSASGNWQMGLLGGNGGIDYGLIGKRLNTFA